MTVFAAIAFATFLLENDHFLTLYERLKHLAIYFCPFNGRDTDLNVAVGIKKKHFVECDGIALLHVVAEMVDIEEFPFLCFELLSFDFYDSVHLLFVIEIQIIRWAEGLAFSFQALAE